MIGEGKGSTKPGGTLPPGGGREEASLVMRLDSASDAGGNDTEQAFHDLVRRTFADAGFRMSGRRWAEVPLDDPPALLSLVERLEALVCDDVVRVAAGHLAFRLEDDEGALLEWFELDPARTFPLRRSAPYQEFSAGDLPPGCHVASGGTHFVSEAFKRAVEQEGLTGLELLWVKDTGRYRASQWYEAMPVAPIGRGLDHPWFDRAAFEAWWARGGDTLAMTERAIAASHGVERLVFEASRDELPRRRAKAIGKEARRFGARVFDNRFFRAGAGFADERDRLVRLFVFEDLLNSLRVSSPLVVLRRFLPPTDFAFSWGGLDGGARDDDTVRFGRVCFNRRVRDVLLRRKLVRPHECRGVRVLDEAPPDSSVFDDPERSPPRLIGVDELARLREDEARHWARFVSRPRQERAVTLVAALALLKAARRQQAEGFGKPARPKALDAAEAELGRPLPAGWRAVLQLADGFENTSVEEPCRVMGTAEIASFHRETRHSVERTLGRPEPGLVFVGHWSAGDLLALEAPPGPRREGCPVLRIDHEDLTEARRWNGVAELLDELLSPP